MKKIALISIILLSGCAVQENKTQSQISSDQSSPDVLLEKGYAHLSNRETRKAIEYFDKAIAGCEGQYTNNEDSVYASRGTTETLYYLMKAASEKRSAVAVSPTCADALYLKGYAVLDFGQVEQAEMFLKRAVDMAPVNSMYLSELGHVYHVKREWSMALEIFMQAEEAAEKFSPPAVKEQELTRAMRGVGFSLIELGRLDEAEEKFRACLKINKDDQMANNELEHIQRLRGTAQSEQ